MLRVAQRINVYSCILAAVALATPAGATLYTGTLSTDYDPTDPFSGDGLLTASTGSPSWGAGSTLTWVVDTAYAPGLVKYTYTLTVANKPAAGISHMILERSANFGTEDVYSSNEPNYFVEYLPVNSGSPNMPSGINGIKIEFIEAEKTQILELITTRVPVWGDVYFKGGGKNELWNAGFGNAAEESDPTSDYYDPVDPPADGLILNHLLVPDTVPEPTISVLLGVGGLGLLLKKYKTRR